MNFQAPSKHPVIDFSHENLKPGTSIWLSTSTQVKNALENHGIFLAKYDQISSEVKNALYQAMNEFYDLPREKKCQLTANKPYLGYSGKIRDKPPMFESIAFEDPTRVGAFEGFTNLFCSSTMKDHVSEVMQSYSKKVAELQEMILRMVYESYGVEKYYESLIESLAYVCRFSKYGAVKLNEKNGGLFPHTDGSFMTIIHQNRINGLEVKSKDGSWVPVDFPDPSSFAILAGDALMAWSNGRIASKVHRVIMVADEPRYSINSFCYRHGIVEAPKELVDEQHPLLFKPFNHFEFVTSIVEKALFLIEDKLKVLYGI